MTRVRVLLVRAAAICPALVAGAGVEIETFDGGVFTNPVIRHEFEFNDPCCWEIVFRNDLGSFALHLRPNTDTITFDLPAGRRVQAVSVRVLDFEGGFVGNRPTSAVVVRAASGDFVSLHAAAIGVPEVVSADHTTPGQLTGEPLGEIVSIQFQAANEGNSVIPGQIGGFFDDITIEFDIPADVNGDGRVDVLDLLALLAAWGPCPGCPEDITGDGVVDVLDLLELLAAWG